MTIVLKDGTVLPDLPSEYAENYPYAVIYSFELSGKTGYYLNMTETPLYFIPAELNGGTDAILCTTQGFIGFDAAVSGDTEWIDPRIEEGYMGGPGSDGVPFLSDLNQVVWTNHDILTLVNFEATETTITVTETGDVWMAKSPNGYFKADNGDILPAIPTDHLDECPYVVVLRQLTDPDTPVTYTAICCEKQFYAIPKELADMGELNDYISAVLFIPNGKRYVCVCNDDRTEWIPQVNEETGEYITVAPEPSPCPLLNYLVISISLIWTNHDIYEVISVNEETFEATIGEKIVFVGSEYSGPETFNDVKGADIFNIAQGVRKIGKVQKYTFKELAEGLDGSDIGWMHKMMNNMSRDILSRETAILLSNFTCEATDFDPYPFVLFPYCRALSLPNATHIGAYAIFNMLLLDSLTTPNVVEIAPHGFSTCSTLSTLDFPKLKKIGEYGLQVGTALKTISMPEVEEIGVKALSGCANIQSLDIPKIKRLGTDAFYACKFTSVFLPASLEFMGDGDSVPGNPFSNCIELKTITIDADNPNYWVDSVYGNIYSPANEKTILIRASMDITEMESIHTHDTEVIADSAFKGNTSLTSVVLNSVVTTIGAGAFGDCSALRTVDIPASVSKLESNTFVNCSGLKTLILRKADGIVETNGCGLPDSFASDTKSAICVPSSELVATYKAHRYWSKFADRFRILQA